MKFLKYKNLLVMATLVVFAGCQSYVNEVDEVDPTAPTDATVDLVLTSSQVAYIGFVEGDLARMAGIFTDQFTGADRQYSSLELYSVTSGDFDSQWGNVYANVLKSFDIVIDKGTVAGNEVTVGIAQMMKAHTVGMAAALWGDVPFSQAGQQEEFPNPAYDSQASVYAGAIALLDQAIVNLGGIGNATGDIFGLSAGQYIEIANTMKARFLLHTGDYAGAITAAQNGISSGANDFEMPHGTGYNQDFNIYYSFLVYDRVGYMTAESSFAPLLLDPAAAEYRGNAKTDEEARLLWYYLPTPYLGDIYTSGTELNYLSMYDWGAGDGFFGTETSFPVITYAENNLILAEATLRQSNDFAGALGHLNTHRAYLTSGAWEWPTSTNQTFFGFVPQYDAYVAADFAAGGMENADNIAANDALYREIVEEKYVTLLGRLEVFNDMRRSGYGSFSGVQNYSVMGLTPKAGSEFPQRFLYSQNEINSNSSAPTPPGLFDKTAIIK